MTVYVILTIVVLAAALVGMRVYAEDSKSKARALIFDLAAVCISAIWAVRFVLRVHFTAEMLVAIVSIAVVLVAGIHLFKDLFKS